MVLTLWEGPSLTPWWTPQLTEVAELLVPGQAPDLKSTVSPLRWDPACVCFGFPCHPLPVAPSTHPLVVHMGQDSCHQLHEENDKQQAEVLGARREKGHTRG